MPYRDPRIDQDRAVMAAVADRFRKARIGQNVTEEFMAEQLGTYERFVKDFEKGESTASWAMISRWGRMLGFSVTDIEQIEMVARRENNEEIAA